MSFMLQAMAAHALTAGYISAHRASHVLAGGNPAVPNPPAQAPPGVSGPISTILGWIKWGALIAGSVGLTVCALMMMIGRRNRSTFAADGAAGVPWVLLGLSLASASSGIVAVFL